MKCYKCGRTLEPGKNTCPGCGTNVKIYKRIMALSNRYYNEGLEKAEVRDLTGSIESLRQSLKFNKNNIDARNLLGLVYYETGEVVAALSEWVISKNLRSDDNLADKYMDMIKNDPSTLDTFNQTIKKYNISLNYCHQDGLDLAVIQLKKVLSMNPGFIRAHLLLSLLYLNNGNYAKARTEAQKCLKLDTGNTMAKRYFKEAEAMLDPGEIKKEEKPAVKAPQSGDVIRYQSGNETIIQPVRSGGIKGSFSIWGIVVGIILGIAASCFLILPARIQAINNSNQKKIISISEESDSKSAKINEYSEQVESLQAQVTELENQINSFEGSNAETDAMDSLMSAVNEYLLDSENIEGIASELEKIDVTLLEDNAISSEFSKLYNSFMTIVGADLSSQYYTLGYQAYKDDDYQNAINYLTRAYSYDSTNVDALFNLGNAYFDNGDTEQAKEIYDKVITDFPDTQSASGAEVKLAEINNADN
ncbi:MAG: tetratricopeptide repeat protein [Butyrivibrio sp.]|nr:tetratricopeptide repeat protein [Butyrivibrio sp.]